MGSNDKLIIHDKCGLPVELCVCPDVPVKYDRSIDRFVEQPPAVNADSANTANNSAMDEIASLCRACEDGALTDETVGMMARDIVKWYRKQLHQ